MKAQQIEFQFKGDRDYIHGTDMFNAMLAAALTTTEHGNIQFTVHDFVRTPLCWLYTADIQEALNRLKGICARCHYNTNQGKHWLALTPGEGDATIGRRYKYDEGQIISLCTIKTDGILLTRESPFSFIESIVAMNKYLHQCLFPEVNGKWIFTRIDLGRRHAERDGLALKFRHNMNYRLTRSDILIRGKKVGDLFFSLVNS
jgi:hypothetical protein